MTLRLFKKGARITMRRAVPIVDGNFKITHLAGETEVTELRMQFRVKRGLTKAPNACDVTITNLSQAARADLECKPLSVRVEAGYDGALRHLFVGDLLFGMTKQNGPDWETMLQLGDGARAFKTARLNRYYESGVTPRMVLEDAARSMGMVLPANLAIDPELDTQMATGFASTGPTRDELTRLLAPYGYTWSVQNNQLQILREEDVRAGQPIVISEEHGMIGTPEFGSPPRSGDPPHMTVKMLLYPEIVPGNVVELGSRAKSGQFRVDQVEHVGDTHGEDWYTELEIKPVGSPIGRRKKRRRR